MISSAIIAILTTLAFSAVCYWIYPPLRNRYHSVSLLISAYGVMIFFVLRSLYNYADQPTSGASSFSALMVSALIIAFTALIAAILFNILQLRSHSTQMYRTTLGVQIFLLIFVVYSGWPAWFYVIR